MFGGKKRKAKEEIETAISAASEALDLNTKDGRGAAYNIIIPALEQAQTLKLLKEQILLFCLLGDVYFSSGDYKTAHSAYTDAIHIDGAIGNAGLHYRLGKTSFIWKIMSGPQMNSPALIWAQAKRFFKMGAKRISTF